MNSSEIAPFDRQVKVFLVVALYVVIAVNLVLIAQNWQPSYQGNDGARFGGTGADLVWIGVSSAAILFAFLWFLTDVSTSRTDRIHAVFCAVELVCFGVFVHHLSRMLWWFG